MASDLYNQVGHAPTVNDVVNRIHQGGDPKAVIADLHAMGCNPDQVIQQLLNNGMIPRGQYNLVAQKAQQIMQMLNAR